jgi:hypothetical protein
MKKQWLAMGLAFCLSALPLPALAVHWMPLGQTDEGLISMDRDSLKRPADTSLLVWEKVTWDKPDALGHTGELRHREYDMKTKKWRQLSSYNLDKKGRKTGGNRKVQEWQPFEPMTPLFTRARYEWDYSRWRGPWVFIKTLPNLGRKWFNPDSLEKKGPNSYQVWEKTVMKNPVNGTKVLLSQTRYDLKNEKARTLYLCTFDEQNNMTDHYAVNDVWNKAGDTYGEYIGDQLATYYAKHPAKVAKTTKNAKKK